LKIHRFGFSKELNKSSIINNKSSIRYMFDFKKLQESDPLKRIVEKQSEQEEFSPMDPPDAYAPPAGEAIPYEKLPSFLQKIR